MFQCKNKKKQTEKAAQNYCYSQVVCIYIATAIRIQC